ncbi:MAG TPA: MOSC domain-containing protein [Anaerolineales bacterium]|nr:MOSC domain-containing protein [Anaerolineales bacterium]
MISETLRPLGKIIRLQLQRSTLTLGERPNRYYDPAALMSVNELILTPQGASARLSDGELVMDIHHADHPHSLNDGGENDLSLNFTSHYLAIRERYGSGDHLYNGCGGENILVEMDGRVTLETLSGGMAVRVQPGGLAWLRRVVVAHPCQPFSKYVSRSTEVEMVKSTLQFLDNGTRGFYCALAHESAVTIAVGDEVGVAPTPS